MNYQIKFGTDGWRSVISDGFTFDNVERIAQATCDVLQKTSKSRLILVGYDNRFLSQAFAETAARVAMGNGFHVEMSNAPVTSPVISFQGKSRKAAIGIMITASHNPAQFNGFKLKGQHGGSVDETLTNEIEANVDNRDVCKSDKPIKKVDLSSQYISWLKKLVPSGNKVPGTVVFDGMHGPGAQIFEKMGNGKNGILFLRKERDYLFGGVNPEPIEENLKILKETVLKKKALIGIAVDGDGDRIGVVDNKGNYIPPHTVMPLLLQHLIESRKLKGSVIQTVSMGYLPSRIAGKYKLSIDEVSVGFKYIAKKMQEEKVLLGGEESGGYGVGLWSCERDGLLCAALLIEMIGKRKKALSDIIDALHQEYGKSYFRRIDFHLKSPVEKGNWTENILKHIKEKIAGHTIKNVNTLDGIKVVLDDDSWVLMRPSGTEPLVRIYSEASSPKIVKELLAEADRLVHLPPPRKVDQSLAGKKRRAKKKELAGK